MAWFDSRQNVRTAGFFAWILTWRMFGKKCSALRDGDWKLITYGKGRVELFNLANDDGAQTDLAEKDPETPVRLKAILEAWLKEQAAFPALLVSGVKSEDRGPGGANQKARTGNKARHLHESAHS